MICFRDVLHLSLGAVRFLLTRWTMPFRLPAFNLNYAIYQGQGIGMVYGTPSSVGVCNLTPGKRSAGNLFQLVPTIPNLFNLAWEVMYGLFPPGTDIRAASWNGFAGDIVEIPAGTQRFYLVYNVDDVAKGFANEYRLAILVYMRSGAGIIAGGLGTPAPVPLP